MEKWVILAVSVLIMILFFRLVVQIEIYRETLKNNGIEDKAKHISHIDVLVFMWGRFSSQLSTGHKTKGLSVQHPHLKPSWEFPILPKGFPTAQVTLYTSGSLTLEYIGQRGWLKKRPVFFKDTEIKVEWPWVDGFEPKAEDWIQIGFQYTPGFDTQSADDKYHNWINCPLATKE